MADGSAKAPSEIDRLVGGLIRAARKDKKISQEELGISIGLTFQQIQKYEKGTNRVSAGRLVQIANALEKPIEYFFNDHLIGDIARQKTAQKDNLVEHLGTRDFARVINALSKIDDPEILRAVIDIIERMAAIKPQMTDLTSE